MMTERQRRFREQYVAGISPWYNGLLHVGVMYAAGISAIVSRSTCISPPGPLRMMMWKVPNSGFFSG